MSPEFDDKYRTTQKGKVVYKRKLHPFKLSDVIRIITSVNNNTTAAIARNTKNAIYIREIFKISGALYALVQDMFDKPEEMSYDSYDEAKEIWRHYNDAIIFEIADFIYTKTDGLIPREAIDLVGRMINRGMEYLFTGSTGY